MGKITEAVIDEFNAEMFKKRSSYRIFKTKDNNYSYEISLKPDPFERDRPMIYPNDQFYELLYQHFMLNGIKIVFNNTRSTFWTNDR